MIDALLSAPLMRAGGPIFTRMAQLGGTDERMRLSRHWDDARESPRILPWILLNPSDASGDRNDPTAFRMIHFTWMWGFDGMSVYNVYPFRTPSPKECAKKVIGWDQRQDWWVRDAINANHSFIAADLAKVDAAIVAWGSPSGRLGIETDLWAPMLFDKINDPDGPRTATLKTWCIGLTGAGHPKHPMARGLHRVPNDARPARIANPGTISIGERL